MAIAAIERSTRAVLFANKLSLNLLTSLVSTSVSANNQTGEAACNSDSNEQSGCTFARFSVSLDNSQEMHPCNVRVFRYPAFDHPRELEFYSSLGVPKVVSSLHVLPFICPSCRHFFSSISVGVSSQTCDASSLGKELENAIEGRRVEEAWTTFVRVKDLEGFPRRSIVNKLIIVLTYSGSLEWLQKAYELVFTFLKKRKWELLGCDSLTLLCLGLARGQMPVHASTILRTMAEKHEYPPANMWSTVIAHMAKSQIGSYLAAEVMIEICSFFKDGRQNNHRLLAMKPNIVAFNIVLNACLIFGSIRKAEEIFKLMPQMGVKADATCFIIMAQIYEKNGSREELKKLKRHIGEDPCMLDHQYHQYYSSLLTSHLNFGDLDAASELVFEMLQRARAKQNIHDAGKCVLEAINKVAQNRSNQMQNAGYTEVDDLPRQSADQVVFEKSSNQHRMAVACGKLQMHPKIQIELENMQKNFVVEVRSNLVNYENGKLLPNEKIYAKLAKCYLKAGRSDELAQFLIRVEQGEGTVSAETSACAQVIEACISLGWLDAAHDMLDEMNAAAAPIWGGLYSSLLKAYCKAKRPMEAANLLKEARKSGVQLDASCYDALVEACVVGSDMCGAQDLFRKMRDAKVSSLTTSCPALMTGISKNSKLTLKAHLLEEIKENQHVIPGVYDMNSVIHFFCKGHMMGDAKKAFENMKNLGYQPNSQTFEYLINGYSSEENYREITMLWADMKRMVNASEESGAKPIRLDRELHDTLLYNFIRGGYFERTLEVITRMEQQNMFIDKWKYKQVFLKYHKGLYNHMRESLAQTDTQFRRREHVLTFKKWAGLI